MAQQGFLYEQNAAKELKALGFSTGAVAGASHDKPDLELISLSHKQPVGCELKISPTAAGSLVMKYSNGKWSYGDTKNDEEKTVLVKLGDKVNLLREMNTGGQYGRNWAGKVPYTQNDAITGRKIRIGAKTPKEAYDLDIAQFGAQNEIKIPIDARFICDYYVTKKCKYINVGTHGFYTLDSSDPLNINKHLSQKLPYFGTSAAAQLRVRCQYKGSGDYQFVLTMEFKKTDKSPYNIAPIKSQTDVNIDFKHPQFPNNSDLFEALRK